MQEVYDRTPKEMACKGEVLMIRRTYHCEVCGDHFEVTCESNDPDPPCPYCEKVLEWVPGMFAITGHKSKAVDLTQQILEQDYGLTNFKDSQREGDITAMMPVETTADREANERMMNELKQQTEDLKRQNHPGMQKAIDGFFAPTGAATAPGVMNTLLASAKVGRQQEGNKYVDPIASTLGAAGGKGLLPTNMKRMVRS